MSEKPSPSRPRGKAQLADAAPETRLVRDLAAILADSGLTEIEVERGDLKVRVARTAAPTYVSAPVSAAPATHVAPAARAPEPSAAPPETPAHRDAADARAHPGAVSSPMVGTVYLRAEPGAAPFVTEGAEVREGQTLLLIEAMKTFNPIPAPRSGRVVELMVRDGEPVEYGKALLIIA